MMSVSALRLLHPPDAAGWVAAVAHRPGLAVYVLYALVKSVENDFALPGLSNDGLRMCHLPLNSVQIHDLTADQTKLLVDQAQIRALYSHPQHPVSSEPASSACYLLPYETTSKTLNSSQAPEAHEILNPQARSPQD
jgi:hypothetical protein